MVTLFDRDAAGFHVNQNAKLAMSMIDDDVIAQANWIQFIRDLRVNNRPLLVGVLRYLVCCIYNCSICRCIYRLCIAKPVLLYEAVSVVQLAAHIRNHQIIGISNRVRAEMAGSKYVLAPVVRVEIMSIKYINSTPQWESESSLAPIRSRANIDLRFGNKIQQIWFLSICILEKHFIVQASQRHLFRKYIEGIEDIDGTTSRHDAIRDDGDSRRHAVLV